KSSPQRHSRNDTAYLTASSTCRYRTRSKSFILHGGRSKHLIAEVAAEILGCTQVHLSSQLFGEFQLHPGDAEQTWRFTRLELNQNVNIAVGPESLSEDRPEQR